MCPVDDSRCDRCCTQWHLLLYIYDLVPKGYARGYAPQLKIKHCWKLFLFEILCCVLAWMNEYIVQIISATSTLTIVVFFINWSRVFALYVHQMCCKLELKTLNDRKKTASLRNHWKRRVFRSMHLRYTAILFFFQRSFARNLKNISLIVWYCCNIWRPYKIANILYKTNEKAVSFLSTTSGTSRDLSQVPSFFQPHGVSLFRNIERCVVVSFSGATSVQWSDVEHALCAFSGVCLDYFQVFCRFGCAKWKYCEKWHLPTPKIWNLFFYTWSSTAWRISLWQGNIL